MIQHPDYFSTLYFAGRLASTEGKLCTVATGLSTKACMGVSGGQRLCFEIASFERLMFSENSFTLTLKTLQRKREACQTLVAATKTYKDRQTLTR
jgi:hypothetical protein